MNEQKKMKEAIFRLGRLKAAQGVPEHFQYELNAFLASARSVQIYAHEEAKAGGPQQLQLYQNAASGHSIFKYMREKRDTTIHQEPIEATVHHTVSTSVTTSVIIFDETGIVPSPPPPQPNVTSPRAQYRYRFYDWTGQEDVLTLCQRYLTELEAFVNDGVNQGFISG